METVAGLQSLKGTVNPLTPAATQETINPKLQLLKSLGKLKSNWLSPLPSAYLLGDWPTFISPALTGPHMGPGRDPLATGHRGELIKLDSTSLMVVIWTGLCAKAVTFTADLEQRSSQWFMANNVKGSHFEDSPSLCTPPSLCLEWQSAILTWQPRKKTAGHLGALSSYVKRELMWKEGASFEQLLRCHNLLCGCRDGS